MNTPLRLLAGERLYTDVYYLYGPFAPYLNTALYALAGIHLNTLYGAGIVGSILLLVLMFELGANLTGPSEAALTVWLVMVFCVFKQDGNYIFPYTYSAVYGTILGVSALAAQVRYARTSPLARVDAFRRSRRPGAHLQDRVRLCRDDECVGSRAFRTAWRPRPCHGWGTLACAGDWPVYLRRPVVERVVGEPGHGHVSVAVRYPLGARLLQPDKTRPQRSREDDPRNAQRGGDAGVIGHCRDHCGRCACGPGCGIHAPAVGRLPRPWLRRLVFIAGASAAALLINRVMYKTRWDVSPFRALPVLCLAAIYVYARRFYRAQEPDAQQRSLFVVSIYSLAVLGRVILRVPSGGAYGAYLLPVPLLLFTHLATRFYRPVLGAFPLAAVRARQTVLALFITGLTAATAVIAYRYVTADYVALKTARGTVRLSSADRVAFAGALDFITRHTQPGEYVAAVPEGSSLNFLGDRPAPLRYEILTPGFLTVEGERRAVAQLEAKQVNVIFLLNRPTREFGCPAFGRDCYRILGQWIEDNYNAAAVFGERASLGSQIGDTRFFIKALTAATP